MRFHLAAATDDETLMFVEYTVHAAARQSELLEDGDIPAGQLRIAYQKSRASKGGEPRPTKYAFFPSMPSGLSGLA